MTDPIQESWISRAPRRSSAAAEGMVLHDENTALAYPGISMAFLHEGQEPVEVTFVSTPAEILRFAERIRQQAEKAIKKSRIKRGEMMAEAREKAKTIGEALAEQGLSIDGGEALADVPGQESLLEQEEGSDG